jgi:predicted SprT family Zn-dependent metalloprotease
VVILIEEKQNIIGLALNELYRAFDILNEEKFQGELKPVVITIQDEKDAYGHFVPSKIWINKDKELDQQEENENEDGYYEINLNPRYFNERTPTQIIGTLLHEMCHYWNQTHGIQDCSGKRHNKHFKSTAESVGFIVYKISGYGFGGTQLTEELEEFINDKINPDEKVFEYFRHIQAKVKEKKKRRKNIFNYECPRCGQIIKGKKNISVFCGVCSTMFEMEEEEKEDEDNESENNSDNI